MYVVRSNVCCALCVLIVVVAFVGEVLFDLSAVV